jgi:hypothetical protein
LLEGLTKGTEEVTEASEKLAGELSKDGGLIDQLGNELDLVGRLADAHYAERDAIEAKKKEMLDYIKALEELLALEAGVESIEQEKIKGTDWSSEMAEYIADGGKYGDEKYKELEANRDEKNKILGTEEQWGKDTEWSKNIANINQGYSDLTDEQKASYEGQRIKGLLS